MRFQNTGFIRFSFVLMCTLTFTFSGCGDDDAPATPVTIAGFSPRSGFVGDEVTISGTGFGISGNEVKFNDAVAIISSSTSTQLRVVVPSGATSGKIMVTSNGQTVTSSESFSIDDLPLQVAGPSISSFSPSSGLVGTQVMITGTDFSTSGNVVKFNGTPAAVSNATATQLTVAVPAGASSGKITVAADGGTAISEADFTVLTPPTVVSFSPTSGIVGDEVVITGANFSTVLSDISVTINGSAAEIRAASATQMSVVVPAEARTGKIAVTVNGLSVTSNNDFTILTPTITSFTPTIGSENVSVVITGTNFCNIVEQNIVKFNGKTGVVTAASRTELTVKIPAGTTTGKVSVKIGPNTVTSTQTLSICNLPELMVTKVVITNISANNKVCDYKITIFNPGGQPLDMSKWILQIYIAKNANGTDTNGSGGEDLKGMGTIKSGGSAEFSGSFNTSSTFAIYPYLVLTFNQKVSNSVSECNPNNNLVVKPIIL